MHRYIFVIFNSGSSNDLEACNKKGFSDRYSHFKEVVKQRFRDLRWE